MPKKSSRRTKRIRNLVVVFSLTAIILSVSTFAWFIGMRTVNVSSFDVEIAATDSLLLSLDGSKFASTVSISKEDLEAVSYAGNTNSWGGTGLIPMSSVGDMDTAASRMKLFEKASLTTTPGGYRLLASQVDNYTKDGEGVLTSEKGGYVVFDLFVKNFSGTQYITDLDEKDEEAIYLTTDSAVTVAQGGVANTGIENSVRVAFAQIGRVAGTTADTAAITGITCTTDSAVTGICREAQIWEPNDTKHVANAISWYQTSCTKRTGADVTLKASYGSYANVEDKCGEVVNGTSYNTYAVSAPIANTDNVDVYDGTEYNGYVDAASKLDAVNYFTDTEKELKGTERPTFMTFAPNSITKVRVYIYIEGQDIDNYDFASIGKKISVRFGFTKERMDESDINYTDPTNPLRPVISLAEGTTKDVTLTAGTAFNPMDGVTAVDKAAADITSNITVTGDIDTSKAGTYTLRYNVADVDGYPANELVRTITVTE